MASRGREKKITTYIINLTFLQIMKKQGTQVSLHPHGVIIVLKLTTQTWKQCIKWDKNEPPHDKTSKMTYVPSKDSDQPGHPPRSESSLCAEWVAKDQSFLHADSEYSDQTGQMPRLIWVFAGRTCHFVGFVMLQLKCEDTCNKEVQSHTK